MDELKLPPEVSSQLVDVVELRLFIENSLAHLSLHCVAQDGASAIRSH